MITEFICSFSKFQLPEQFLLTFKMASGYILGEMTRIKKDYRHLEPTLLKSLKKAWCCKAVSVGKRTGCFCPPIASSKLCCFPGGTIEQTGLGAQNIK